MCTWRMDRVAMAVLQYLPTPLLLANRGRHGAHLGVQPRHEVLSGWRHSWDCVLPLGGWLSPGLRRKGGLWHAGSRISVLTALPPK